MVKLHHSRRNFVTDGTYLTWRLKCFLSRQPLNLLKQNSPVTKPFLLLQSNEKPFFYALHYLVERRSRDTLGAASA